MTELHEQHENPNSVTIFQGLLFQRVHKREKYGLTVVTDIGEGDIFTAAGVVLHNKQYELTGAPGGLYAENIGKLVRSLTTDQLVEAATIGKQHGIPITQELIQELQRAAGSGSRTLLRRK